MNSFIFLEKKKLKYLQTKAKYILRIANDKKAATGERPALIRVKQPPFTVVF